VKTSQTLDEALPLHKVCTVSNKFNRIGVLLTLATVTGIQLATWQPGTELANRRSRDVQCQHPVAQQPTVKYKNNADRLLLLVAYEYETKTKAN
jgi:hypothetical protein